MSLFLRIPPDPIEQVYSTTGTTDSIIITGNTDILIVNPTNIMNNLTITLPENPRNGKEIKITFGGLILTGKVIKNLTIQGNTGQTALGSENIGVANASDGYIFKYQFSENLWRIY